MRRSRSRAAALNGFAFDAVAPAVVFPAASHASRNITPGTGTADCPVSMRSSSLSGSALRSPHSTAGNERGRCSRTSRQISATWAWRIALWSSRQLRCAQ